MGGPARPLLERRAVVAVHDSGSLCTVTPKRPVMHAVRLRRKQLHENHCQRNLLERGCVHVTPKRPALPTPERLRLQPTSDTANHGVESLRSSPGRLFMVISPIEPRRVRRATAVECSVQRNAYKFYIRHCIRNST